MSTFADQLSRILSDRRSGSSTLAIRLIKLLKGHLENRRKYSSQASVRSLLDRVVTTFPTMALLYNLRQRSIRVLRRRTGDWRTALCRELEDFHAGLVSSADLAARHFASAASTDRVLLTLSASGAVMSALRAANARHRLSVIVCESCPVREGVAMARALSRHGVRTKVVTDAAGGGLVEVVDAVVLGTDWLHPSGFVNKTGSRMLSDIACLYRKETYVIGSKLRFNRKRPPFPPRRITHPFRVASLSDFEWVAWNDSHCLVTESGAGSPIDLLSPS